MKVGEDERERERTREGELRQTNYKEKQVHQDELKDVN